MKLKDLLKKLSKMDKKQLDQELIFVSTYESGSCILKKATSDLIYTGDDDPSELYTKKQLLEEGYDKYPRLLHYRDDYNYDGRS